MTMAAAATTKKTAAPKLKCRSRCAKTLVRVAAAQTVVDFFMVLGGFLHCVLLQKPKKRALPHAFPSISFYFALVDRRQ